MIEILINTTAFTCARIFIQISLLLCFSKLKNLPGYRWEEVPTKRSPDCYIRVVDGKIRKELMGNKFEESFEDLSQRVGYVCLFIFLAPPSPSLSLCLALLSHPCLILPLLSALLPFSLSALSSCSFASYLIFSFLFCRRSAIDNTVLPNVMTPLEAKVLLAGWSSLSLSPLSSSLSSRTLLSSSLLFSLLSSPLLASPRSLFSSALFFLSLSQAILLVQP